MNIEAIRARVEKASVQFKIEAKSLLNGIFIEPHSTENVEFLTYAAHDITDLLAEVERLNHVVVDRNVELATIKAERDKAIEQGVSAIALIKQEQLKHHGQTENIREHCVALYELGYARGVLCYFDDKPTKENT